MRHVTERRAAKAHVVCVSESTRGSCASSTLAAHRAGSRRRTTRRSPRSTRPGGVLTAPPAWQRCMRVRSRAAEGRGRRGSRRVATARVLARRRTASRDHLTARAGVTESRVDCSTSRGVAYRPEGAQRRARALYRLRSAASASPRECVAMTGVIGYARTGSRGRLATPAASFAEEITRFTTRSPRCARLCQ